MPRTAGSRTIVKPTVTMIDDARRYREQEGLVGKGGVVVFFQGEVQGWVNKLRNPEHWQQVKTRGRLRRKELARMLKDEGIPSVRNCLLLSPAMRRRLTTFEDMSVERGYTQADSADASACRAGPEA